MGAPLIMGEVADNVLVDRVVLRGDKHAFSELVKRYQSMLRYSLRQMTGWNESLADELAQEAFIKAYTSIASFRKEAKFSSWLYRIALNLYRSHLRKKGLNTEPMEDQEFATDADPQVSPGLQQDLASAMQKLSFDQRTAIHLSLHRECSHQEISDIMGIPLGTVKTHINRGKERLQTELQGWRH